MKVVGTDLIEGIDLLQCKSGNNMYMGTDERRINIDVGCILLFMRLRGLVSFFSNWMFMCRICLICLTFSELKMKE